MKAWAASLALVCIKLAVCSDGFCFLAPLLPSTPSTYPSYRWTGGPPFLGHHNSALAASPEPQDDAKALLQKVRKMREEIASLEGRSVDEVEKEAQDKAKKKLERQEQVQAERQTRKNRSQTAVAMKSDGRFLNVPETVDDQVQQAADAVKRAMKDGISRQTIRFALVPEDEVLNQEDRQWPGGAQQMYREAAGPLTRRLLRILGTGDDFRKPNITSQDVWDFDGSALVTAEVPAGAQNDIQALVFPNTDDKYPQDIRTIDAAMKDRLFLLVNPFWRNLDSWGINLFAPNAKKLAQEAIFDRGFNETYVLLQKTVRGEDCIALKAYPYDWQMFAYIENDYWPHDETILHLGTTAAEPTAAEFAELLNGREEFKLSKNMRQVQRMMGKNDE